MLDALFRGLTQKLFALQSPRLNIFLNNHANKGTILVSFNFHANLRRGLCKNYFYCARRFSVTTQMYTGNQALSNLPMPINLSLAGVKFLCICWVSEFV